MSKRKKYDPLNKGMRGKSRQTTLPGMDSNNLWEEMHLSLSDLYSGQPYQRPIKDRVVDRLVREWDPRLLTPLVVSYREGRYYLVDGQHRACAMRKKNSGKDVTARRYSPPMASASFPSMTALTPPTSRTATICISA